GAIDFIRRNQGAWREFILLPHSIRAYGDTLNSLDKNCYIFCREEPSYEFVRSCISNANVFLSHDLALAWDVRTTVAEMRKRRFRDAITFLRHVRSNITYERVLQR